MNHMSELLTKLESEINKIQSEKKETSEKNINLFKILATVKCDLEKTLKKPESLKETVYSCIDLLRANTPYYSTNEGKNKIDPPLKDEEKTL